MFLVLGSLAEKIVGGPFCEQNWRLGNDCAFATAGRILYLNTFMCFMSERSELARRLQACPLYGLNGKPILGSSKMWVFIFLYRFAKHIL